MLNRLIRFIRLFLKGSLVDSSTDKIEFFAKSSDDYFLTLIFSQYLGIPNPMYYYMVELLPFVSSDLIGWQRRMANKKTLIASIAAEIGEP